MSYFSTNCQLGFLLPTITLLLVLIQVQGQRIGPIIECKTPGMVALTFDDGPHADYTHKVLDVLKEFNVTVTFFVNGLYNYEDDEQGYKEKIFRAYNEGHQIGSHTQNHSNMSGLTKAAIRADLLSLSQRIESILQRNMTVFRPPYGEYDDNLLDVVQDEFGYDVINWNVDTEDWRHPNDTDASLQNWINAIEANADNPEKSYIGLHHDVNSGAPELARKALVYLQSKNLTVVTVAKCIGGEMYQQISGPAPGPGNEDDDDDGNSGVRSHQSQFINVLIVLILTKAVISLWN